MFLAVSQPSGFINHLFFFLAEDKEGDEEGEADASRAEEKEAPPPAENPDLEVIVEALKSICNILLHNETGQVSLSHSQSLVEADLLI